jgi:cellulose synthase/poly-beta-1,6-N-acetylglucosamine synthase-like glycosyltransferase
VIQQYQTYRDGLRRRIQKELDVSLLNPIQIPSDHKARLEDNPRLNVVCLQARLNYENLNDNWIISLFKADYASWFFYYLPGLHIWNLPIPLGGTSNHFQHEYLYEAGGWDAYNVTEDCDLGIWIARDNRQVNILNSITWEIAEPGLITWVKQRSRWIKGYAQTYFVHMTQLQSLWRDLGGLKRFTGFQLTVGAGFLLPMIAPFFYVVTIAYILMLVLSTIGVIAFGTPPPPLIQDTLNYIYDIHYPPFLPIGTGAFFVTNVIYFLILVLGHIRHPKPGRLYFIAGFWVLYWIFMTIAAVKASWEYLFDPFYWDKTTHNIG